MASAPVSEPTPVSSTIWTLASIMLPDARAPEQFRIIAIEAHEVDGPDRQTAFKLTRATIDELSCHAARRIKTEDFERAAEDFTFRDDSLELETFEDGTGELSGVHPKTVKGLIAGLLS